MKNFYLAALALISFAVNVQADNIDDARSVAMRKLNQNVTAVTASASQAKAIDNSTATANESYYIFNGEKDGFAIVSAESQPSILGYSESGSIDGDNMPEALQCVLDLYASGKASYAKTTAEAGKYTAIEPMVKTTWGQGEPYNRMTPTINGQHCLTGCVATAFSQVMNYWKKPVGAMSGQFTFTGPNNGQEGIPTTVDMSKFTIDWDNMLPAYTIGSFNDEQANAVAQLMYACGVMVGMNWGLYDSAAYSQDLINHLAENCNYSDQIRQYQSEFMDFGQWKKMIYEELQAKRPVVYDASVASTFEGGHCFILDGMDEDGLVHVNWGWCGLQNGYYSMSLMTPYDLNIGNKDPIGESYSCYNEAVFGLCPKGEPEKVWDMNTHIKLIDMTMGNGYWQWPNLRELHASGTDKSAMAMKIKVENNCNTFKGTINLNIYKPGETTPVKKFTENVELDIKKNMEVTFNGSLEDLPVGNYKVTLTSQNLRNTNETEEKLKTRGLVADTLDMEITETGYTLTMPDPAEKLKISMKVHPLDRDTLYTMNYMPAVYFDITNNGNVPYVRNMYEYNENGTLKLNYFAGGMDIPEEMVGIDVGVGETVTACFVQADRKLSNYYSDYVGQKIGYFVSDNMTKTYSDTLYFYLKKSEEPADSIYVRFNTSCEMAGKVVAPGVDPVIHVKATGYSHVTDGIILKIQTTDGESHRLLPKTCFDIAPGETKEFDELLKGEYYMTLPGKYTLQVCDILNENSIIATYEFTVENPTAVSQIAAEKDVNPVSKFMSNGKLVISKGNNRYNAAGQQIR